MSTLGVEECAALLRVDKSTTLELAQSGELPGAKIGKAWVFIYEDVMNYLRMKVEQQVAERRALAEEGFKPRVDSVMKQHKKRGRPRLFSPQPA